MLDYCWILIEITRKIHVVSETSSLKFTGKHTGNVRVVDVKCCVLCCWILVEIARKTHVVSVESSSKFTRKHSRNVRVVDVKCCCVLCCWILVEITRETHVVSVSRSSLKIIRKHSRNVCVVDVKYNKSCTMLLDSGRDHKKNSRRFRDKFIEIHQITHQKCSYCWC